MLIESGLLAEKFPQIGILGGIASYVIALLFLTVMGSPVFFFGCYIGTILIVSAVLAKMEMFTFVTRRHALFVILIFASAMLITTALVSVFADIGLSIRITHDVKEIQRVAYFWNRDGRSLGTYLPHGCSETRAIYPMGNFNFEILRPWTWIFGPALIIGVALFVAALLVVYRSE